MQLNWLKCTSGNWCSLERLDLSSITVKQGVYIIWYQGQQSSKVVRVGQGNIAERLSAHRNDPKILHYKSFGPLMVTWASVSSQHLDGVERYLADTWTPLVGDAFPNARPIAVSSPWQ